MALQKSFSSGFGIDAPEGYHRIKSVAGDVEGNISYIVELYYDKAARDSGKAPLSILSKSVPQDMQSRIGVIYELYQILKLEPEYADALDVIDPSNFDTASNLDVTNAYVIDGYLDDGYALSGGAASGVNFSGKVVLGGQVISGTFTGADITGGVERGGRGVQGLLTAGTANGLIVQNLV